MVPDKDYFSCAEDEISFLTSELTMVGGKVVYGAGDFRTLDESNIPPAMPDWSPVRTFGGYAAWGEPQGAGKNSLRRAAISSCGCANDCGVYGHDHAGAWTSKLPIADLKGFFGRWAAPAGQSEPGQQKNPPGSGSPMPGALREYCAIRNYI